VPFGAFSYCAKLESIIVGGGVIEDNAFY